MFLSNSIPHIELINNIFSISSTKSEPGILVIINILVNII